MGGVHGGLTELSRERPRRTRPCPAQSNMMDLIQAGKSRVVGIGTEPRYTIRTEARP